MHSLSVDNESHRNHYDVKYDSRSHVLVNVTLGFIVVFRNEYWSYLTTTTSECIDVEIHDVKDSELKNNETIIKRIFRTIRLNLQRQQN